MVRKPMLTVLCWVMIGMLLSACGAGQAAGAAASLAEASVEEQPDTAYQTEKLSSGEETGEDTGTGEEVTEMNMTVQVGEDTFTATLENNAAAEALTEKLEAGPMTIRMEDYGGFEKVGDLGTSLPASNRRITTQTGDIVLYQGSQVVIFYGSNTWSYTRLGHIDDLTGWEEALGGGDVSVTFSLER